MDERLENEQEQERNYFKKQEEKINKTKEKLQTLLDKLQEQPPKDTIAKKILRLRINRLRTQLNRRMEKFNIEYLADSIENETYEEFVTECSELRNRIEELEEQEDDLEYELESYTQKENYRGKNIRKVENKIEKMAPKSRKDSGEKINLKNAPKKNKSKEIQ